MNTDRSSAVRGTPVAAPDVGGSDGETAVAVGVGLAVAGRFDVGP